MSSLGGGAGPTNYLANGRSTKVQVLADVCWYAYLAFLVLISFLTHRYDTANWLYVSAGFYLLISVYGVTVLLGARCNWSALEKAWAIIFCLFVSLVWLFLQMVVPIESTLDSMLGVTQSVPNWFKPDSYLSVVPDKTRWLLFTNIFAFTWFVFTLALLDNRRRMRQLLWTLLAIGTTHAGIAIFAMQSGLFLTDITQLDGHFQVARGWFVNRNHFAAFMNICLVGGIYVIASQLIKKSRQKLLLTVIDQLLSPRVFILAAVLMIVVAILMSQSRGGILTLVVATLAMVSIFSRQRAHLHGHWRRLLLLSILFIGVFAVFGQDLMTRFGTQSLSLGERTTQWSITLDAIKQSWLFGYGGGSYGTVFQIFRDYADLRQVSYNQSHNEYLHIWLEQGFVGLSLWLVALVLVVRQLVLEIPQLKSDFIRVVLIAATIGFTTAILQAGVGFNLQIVNIRCNFFVIIALIFCAPLLLHKKSIRSRQHTRTIKHE